MSELLPGSVWTRKPKTVTLTASLGPGIAYLFDGGSGEMTTERFLEEYQPAAPSPSPAPGVVEALTDIRKASSLDEVVMSAPAAAMARFAEIHQHADAALADGGRGE